MWFMSSTDIILELQTLCPDLHKVHDIVRSSISLKGIENLSEVDVSRILLKDKRLIV